MSNIGEKFGLRKSQLIALIVILALNAYWLISDLIVFSGHFAFSIVATMLEIVIAVFYTLFDYKKPHGNLLKYLLLLHVVLYGIILVNSASYQPKYINAIYFVKTVLISFMAGRLDHFKQNLIICAIVLVCNIVISYYLLDMILIFGLPLNLVNFGSCIGCVTVWLAIADGYIIRYQLHKEAGLEEK